MSERLLQISRLYGAQPSTELVPLDYGRFVFNTLHGTGLEAHKSNLTAEQAKAINDHFDIELYFGKHGTAAGDLVPWREVPTQRDYDAAAKVVEDLQPGDMLFLEAPGFTNPVLMPTPDPQHKAGVSRPGVQARPDYSSVQNYIASMAGQSSALSPLRRY